VLNVTHAMSVIRNLVDLKILNNLSSKKSLIMNPFENIQQLEMNTETNIA